MKLKWQKETGQVDIKKNNLTFWKHKQMEYNIINGINFTLKGEKLKVSTL